MKSRKKTKHRYSVWFEQINYAMLEVEAADAAEAQVLAIRKWHKEVGIPTIRNIEVGLGDPACLDCGGSGTVQGFPQDQECGCLRLATKQEVEAAWKACKKSISRVIKVEKRRK